MSLIKKPNEIEMGHNLRVLIYGQPGIWKTRLALSSPKPLLIDCDGGIHRVDSIWWKDTVQVNNWSDVDAVLNEDLSNYQTLVIDTAGKMIDYMTAFIIKQDPRLSGSVGALTLQGYGVRKGMFNSFLSRVSMLNKHIVFVAHDREEKEGDYRFMRPEIGGSSGNDLIKDIDLVGYMEAKGKKHTISFDPCERFYGKNSLNLQSVVEIKRIESSEDNTYLSDLFSEYIANRKAVSLKRRDYEHQVEELKSIVDLVSDAKGANDFVTGVRNVHFLWDARLIILSYFQKKVTSLGLAMEDRKYIDPADAAIKSGDPNIHPTPIKESEENEEVSSFLSKVQ